MMFHKNGRAICAALLLAGMMVSGCASGISHSRMSYAMSEVREKRAQGQYVWCVPFARDASGINLRGDAHEWWGQARGVYDRGHRPKPGSVMVFERTGRLQSGHLAVVSRVISKRKIRVSHANWERGKVSRDMLVVDISRRNDWSQVRLESQRGQLGSAYPVRGFIYR